nr:multiple epidermal growth factor-like domains protein 10 [Crassostrea gigas]
MLRERHKTMSVTELRCISNSRLILSTILFLIFKVVVESEEICNGTIGRCCKGYFWNFGTNKCEECTPGYTGPNCTAQCPYPTYGFACQGFCNCSNDTCNMSWGFITFTTLTSNNGAKHERGTKQEEVKWHNTLLDHVNEGMDNSVCTV